MPESFNEELSAIRTALGAGRLDHAARLLAQLTASQRQDPNARLLQAVLLRRDGRPAEALRILTQLAARHPAQPGIVLQHANTLKALGRTQEAAALYSELLVSRPADAQILFNLACCQRQSDPHLGGAQFLAAAQASPRLWDAYRGALECARALPAHAQAAPPAKADATPLVSVVCCSVSPDKLNSLVGNLNERLGHWELVHIADARSLCEGYARGLRRARGDLLVFCHDDIRVLAPDFSTRLRAHLQSFDLIGVAGSTHCTGPAALWGGPASSHGWICYREADRRLVSIASAWGPVISGAQVLDGVFLAGHRRVFEAVGFDADTFDGFHLYDLDFTWRAHRTGARLGICQDLMIEHASRGNFAAAWTHYAERFRRKFPEIPFGPPAAGPNCVEIAADSDRQVVSIYAWLREWLGALERDRSQLRSGAASGAR